MHKRLGLLLTNLGTPDAPDASSVRRYLREFLWDPRVVELSRPLWWLILNAFVLPFRPRRSAEAYAKIWTAEGSPLLVIARQQAQAIEQKLEERYGRGISLALGMRYGRPSIREALESLRECTHILVVPLYPQYSASTTGSTFDALANVLMRWRWVPDLRLVGGYHDDPGYISALANSVRELWQREGEAQRLLLSFHGLPKSYDDKGDPYRQQCEKTARLLSEKLQLPGERWKMTFQSRFGREEWLQPYTDKTLEAWGAEGLESVDVICPGFSADCLETLEEISIQNREFFQQAGGGRFRYIPALNDRPDHIDALVNLLAAQLQGWIPGRVSSSTSTSG